MAIFSKFVPCVAAVAKAACCGSRLCRTILLMATSTAGTNFFSTCCWTVNTMKLTRSSLSLDVTAGTPALVQWVGSWSDWCWCQIPGHPSEGPRRPLAGAHPSSPYHHSGLLGHADPWGLPHISSHIFLQHHVSNLAVITRYYINLATKRKKLIGQKTYAENTLNCKTLFIGRHSARGGKGKRTKKPGPRVEF